MITRRTFIQTASAGLAVTGRQASAQTRFAVQNSPTEWSYSSGKPYKDPFNDVELDVVFSSASGDRIRMPAFWAGDQTWRIRFAPPQAGRYSFETVCSDTGNSSLHGQKGTLTVETYTGSNPLARHGGIRVAQDRRHFEHVDRTPFFWLGDTWWMGLCKRFGWPDDFQTLTADRVRKGFNVVQIVAGLYPDMDPYDERGANEAGYPWEKGYARINPAYFDMADARIQYLTEHGIAPCVVGFWGYFLPQMGIARAKQHWRYLVARWGAYPAIWCLAGEGTMPFYLSKTREKDEETQRQGLTELARYVRSINGMRRIITIHPSKNARACIDDPSLLDFDMMQTGHGDRKSVPNTVESVRASLEATPKMPALVGEVCYEGIQEASREEVQRFLFWSCILSGAGGHTYGANGIWQVNTPSRPFGLSPHGHSWGGPPWNVAAQLPGSGQLGLAKALLSRYSWWKLEPNPALVEPHWTKQDYWQPFAGHIPGEAVIVFTPSGGRALQFRNLAQGPYRAYLFNPSDGAETALGNVTVDASGSWKGPEFPIFRDWILVLDRKG